jgi:Tfp pilus assembly protein PilF
MRAAMVTYGQGLSTLSMMGVAAVPKKVFTAFRLVLWAVTLVIYYRHLPRVRELVWLLPAFVLWFGHRSLTSYWYFNLVPFVFALALRLGSERGVAMGTPRRWRWDAAALGAVLAAIAAVTVWFATRSPSLHLRAVGPIATHGANASAMAVEVHNVGDRPIDPRFTVQSRGTQPFYWQIKSGPRSPLAPGERGTYRIERPAPFASYGLLRGGRLTVIDAGDGDRYATTVLPTDEAHVSPDLIPNGSYRFWERGSPTFWGFVDECGGGAALAWAEPAAEGTPATALRMELSPSHRHRCAYLDTYLFLPERTVRLWVKRPSRAGTPEEGLARYGLRLVLGEGVLWILFGAEQGSGQLGPDERFLVLPTPAETWHLQQLDLPRLLAQAGFDPGAWRTPVPRFEYLDFPVMAVNLQLIVRFEPGDRAVAATFGPIHTSDDAGLDQRFERDLERPQEHLLWRAELDLATRNYTKAMERARRGLATAPAAGRAHLTLAEAAFWSRDLDVAGTHYERAIELEYAPALAHKGLGWVRHAQRRFGDAIRSWEQALVALGDAKGPEALIHAEDCLRGMTMTYVQTDRCDDATALLRRAEREFPNVRLPSEEAASCPKTVDHGEP